MKQIKRSLHDLFEKYKFVRRLVLFWFLSLVTFATMRVFDSMTDVGAAVATVYSSLVGMNVIVFKFYCDGRIKDGNGS